MSNYIYFVNGSASAGPMNAILRVTQSGNGTFAAPTPITINGAVNQNAVDPNVLILPDGQFLLTYTFGNFGFPNASNVFTIYTAVSSDGINFTSAQPAFINNSGTQITDPTEIQLQDGTFLAAVSSLTGNPANNFVTFYRSADGQTFSPNRRHSVGLHFSRPGVGAERQRASLLWRRRRNRQPNQPR
jgi:hypothetical protein